MYCYIIVLIIELVGHMIKLYLINLQTEVYQLQHNAFLSPFYKHKSSQPM